MFKSLALFLLALASARAQGPFSGFGRGLRGGGGGGGGPRFNPDDLFGARASGTCPQQVKAASQCMEGKPDMGGPKEALMECLAPLPGCERVQALRSMKACVQEQVGDGFKAELKQRMGTCLREAGVAKDPTVLKLVFVRRFSKALAAKMASEMSGGNPLAKAQKLMAKAQKVCPGFNFLQLRSFGQCMRPTMERMKSESCTQLVSVDCADKLEQRLVVNRAAVCRCAQPLLEALGSRREELRALVEDCAEVAGVVLTDAMRAKFQAKLAKLREAKQRWCAGEDLEAIVKDMVAKMKDDF